MDPGAVCRYLTERLGAGPVLVTSLHQTFPGQSQETWLVDATVDGEPRGFVLRGNPPGGGIVPFPLRREWEVYRRLTGSPVPVATPLWFDEGACGLFGGRPFFVRDLVPGSTHVPGLQDDPALRRAVAHEHARALAAVHTLDWEALGLGEVLDPPTGPADAARHEVETWWRIFDEVRPGPMPVVTEALYWLHDQLPRAAPCVALLKGNNGLGEEIWRDGRIVALSDWELASLGDPAQDWAFSQGMLALADAEETLRFYESVAGFTLVRENLAFYRVWTVVKALCCVTAGLRGFLDGRDPRVALPAMGFGGVKVMESLLATMVTMDLAAAAELVAALEGSRLSEPAAGGEGRG
ncbi:MAG: phosphotransferase family protein [Acidimicrobiia bacterium]|nr:phosphotransferase family protein [Acidimicrobiia bacterium]